jgi:hypothetical protein
VTAEVMRADPAALRSTEPAFDTMASAVDGLLVRLAGALDVEGACWGEDEVGSAFEQGYLPVALGLREALPRLRDLMTGTGAQVLAVADNVDGADGRAQSRFE